VRRRTGPPDTKRRPVRDRPAPGVAERNCPAPVAGSRPVPSGPNNVPGRARVPGNRSCCVPGRTGAQ